MRARRGLLVVSATGLWLAAQAALAQPAGPGPGRPGRPPHGFPPGMTQELSLTEAQEQKLRGIMEEQRPQREALRERIAANRDALNELLESGSADANAVGQLVLEGRKLHEEARAQREAEQKAIRGLLTPDQQKKFDAMQERRRDRGPGRGPDPRGPGGWPGQGSGGGPGGPGGGMPRPPLGQSKSGQQPFLP